MRRYAEDTSVSTDNSIGEIRSTLRRVMFRVAMPDIKNKEFQLTPTGRWSRTEKQAFDAWEQACRARWRSLALVIKAKLEAVASGITEFETEYMGNVLMPDDRTVAEHIRPRIAEAYAAGEMRPLLAPLGEPKVCVSYGERFAADWDGAAAAWCRGSTAGRSGSAGAVSNAGA
jgi:hypothetical protein